MVLSYGMVLGTGTWRWSSVYAQFKLKKTIRFQERSEWIDNYHYRHDLGSGVGRW